jgi:serine protease Do
MRRIILRHISGSKANQVDEFPVDQFKILTLGRDTDQTIRYDPERDDLVSKQHARIFCEEGHDDRFLITDLNSRNGTYVNKQRISDTTSIVPGDVIQLGPGGPEFRFDLEPSPDGMLRSTREAEPVRETQESVLSPRPSSSLTKPPVGRATVERMLSLYQQSSRRTFVNLTAAMVGVIVIVAGGLIYMNLTAKRMGGKIEEITEKMVSIKSAATPADPIMLPAEIASKYGQSTVFIEVSWTLIEESNQQVYHRHVMKNGEKYPTYIKVISEGNQTIVPWLSLNDDSNLNERIGNQVSNEHIGSQLGGSGFVVTDHGFILTNKQLLSPWVIPQKLPNKPSVVYDLDHNSQEVDEGTAKWLSTYELQELWRHVGSAGVWTPLSTQYLVQKKQPKSAGKKQKYGYYVVPNKRFEGRYEINVTFPKNRLSIPARLVRKSDQHDVALLKVDVPPTLQPVEMYADSYTESRPGDKVTVLGYPAVSPDPQVYIRSDAPFFNRSEKKDRVVKVHDLTATDGLIGRIIRGRAIPKGGEASEYHSTYGDVIQLTVTATDKGNIGGPVFDDHGRVIAVFAYAREEDTKITFAVPIRFGLEVMGIKSVLD